MDLGGEVLGGGGNAVYPTLVVVQGNVADIVQFVLDLPMLAVQRQQFGRAASSVGSQVITWSTVVLVLPPAGNPRRGGHCSIHTVLVARSSAGRWNNRRDTGRGVWRHGVRAGGGAGGGKHVRFLSCFASSTY